MIKVSVVIPVYNVEKYLNECIKSIVNQTYKNIEIILVDDESKDKCPQICEQWAIKDNRIKVIHKKNEGLGMARNTGIENATGDYIYFIDSDDMLDINAIEKCCEILNNKKFDILYFGFKNIDENSNIIKEFNPTPIREEYYNDEITKIFLPHILIDLPNKEDNFNMNFSSCMCLINLSLIRNIEWRFCSERDIISEDIYSLLKLFKYIKSVKIISSAYYFYRKNNISLTHLYRKDRFDKLKELHKKCVEVYDNSELIERFDYLFLSYTIASIEIIVNSNLKYLEKLKEIKIIVNDKEMRNISNRNIKNETLIRKIYFTFIKLKCINLVYFFTWLQNKRKVK